ncbi:MAG: hypothetical protein MHM6MM_000597 [Cercozoa sp. M6MM]
MGVCASQAHTATSQSETSRSQRVKETQARVVEKLQPAFSGAQTTKTHDLLPIEMAKQKSLFRADGLLRNLKKLLVSFKANLSKNEDYAEDDKVDLLSPNLEIDEILSNSVLHEAFARFTLAKLAEESLLFVNDVSQYKAHSSKRLLSFIADEYVRRDAPFEINMSASVRQSTEKKIDEALVQTTEELVAEEYQSVLDGADAEIRELLRTNFVSSFVVDFNRRVKQGCEANNVGNGKHRVVVLGAGPGGVAVATGLRNNPNVHLTLINDKEYFEDVPSMVHACVDYTYHEKASIPLRDVFGSDSDQVRLIFGTVRAVRADHVMVGTEQVRYDSLVLATGACYDGNVRTAIGRSQQLRRKQLKKQNLHYKNAKKILIVGGGLTGCGMASEVADIPGKREVTLLSSSCLLRRVPGAHSLVERELASLGVRVICGQGYRVVDADERSVTCRNGETFVFDAIIWAGGPRANSSYVSTFAPIASALTPVGAVKVDKAMRVLSDQGPLNHIFAVGDMITVIDENNDICGFEKNVPFALQSGIAVVQNISAFVRNAEATELAEIELRPGEVHAFISLGRCKTINLTPEYAFVDDEGMQYKTAVQCGVVETLRDHGDSQGALPFVETYYNRIAPILAEAMYEPTKLLLQQQECT